MSFSAPLSLLMNDASTLPEAGRIDLHCHLLPGVDDGCQTIEQSLECVRRLVDAGFAGSVCTPHVGPSWYRNNTPDNIACWLADFRAAIAAAGIDYFVWDGGEVRLSEETIEWFSYWGLPTLGPGKCVLVDWWGDHWPAFCSEACQFLIDNAYQPILAHPERLNLSPRQFDVLLDEMCEMGVWLQGNLNSISGGEGPSAQARAEQLLADDRYFVLASDTHGPDGLDSRLDALRYVEDEFGADNLATLLETRQREVLLHGMVQE